MGVNEHDDIIKIPGFLSGATGPLVGWLVGWLVRSGPFGRMLVNNIEVEQKHTHTLIDSVEENWVDEQLNGLTKSPHRPVAWSRLACRSSE